MKKIILFLALALGVEVNAQVVGGYLPVNSTKSATMGGLRVNGNEIVTGTFSVESTATVSGAFKGNSTIDGASYKMNGTAVVEASNSRVLLGGGSYTAVEISGTKPLIMNSAVLTGGNTGTVAVLSDAVFPVTFNSSAGTNPADATTYYFGNTGWSYNTNSGQGIVTLPYNCTLVSWNYDNLVLGTLGSSEACTVQVSGTTTLNLSSVVTLSATTSNYTGTVNTNFTAGDQINIKFIAPTWATNPTTLVSSMVLWFVRRS